MSFISRIGDAFEATGGAIGATWSAADNLENHDAITQAVFGAIPGNPNQLKAAGSALGAAAGVAGTAVGGASGLLNTAYSYGIARPVSTLAQQLDSANTADSISNASDWGKAWDQSANVSPGQAIYNNLYGALAHIPGEVDSRPAFMRSGDPYAARKNAARKDYFSNSWDTKIASGGIDALMSWYVDPVAIGGKGLKAVGKAKNTIGADKVEGGLSSALGGIDRTKPIDTLDTKPADAAEKQALDSFTEHGDLGQGGKPLDSLLKRSINQDPATVYRTVPDSNLTVGDTYTAATHEAAHSDQYTATAQHDAVDKLPVVMKIEVPAGAPALDVEKVNPETPGEWVLPKGTKYRISDDSTTEIQTPTGAQTVRQLTAHVVDSPFKPPAGQDRWGNKISKIFSDTDGKSASEIATMSQFRNTGDAGIIAYFMGRANELYKGDDEAEKLQRWSFKANILGVALGDQQSMKNVLDLDESLAAEYKALGQSPKVNDATEAFSWDDAGQGMLNLTDPDADKAIQLRKDEIDKEHIRIQRLTDLYGSSNKVVPGIAEGIGDRMRAYKLHESISPQGLGGIPIRYAIGSAQTRVPGFVHLKDPSRGFDDISNVLSQMRHTSAADKQGIADKWVKAATDGDRRNVVDALESKMFQDTAARYGVKPDVARKFLTQTSARRGAHLQKMAQNLYSAADDADWVAVHDPEEGVNHVFSKPLLKTQLEDAAAITDPRVLESALKKGTNKRLLESWLGNKTLNGVDETAQMLDHLGQMYTRGWKDLALMRGAYPIRIQVDTQLRLMASLGKMQYVMNAARGTGRTASHLLESNDTEAARSFSNVFKRTDKERKEARRAGSALVTGEQYKGYNISPALDTQQAQRIVANIASAGGSMADLGNDVETAVLRGDRGTGNWGRIETSDPAWFDNWKRAVQQISGSATGRQALITPDVPELVKWVNSDPAGRAEWLNLSEGYPSQEDWAAKVIASVNHLLPTSDLRGILLKGAGRAEPMSGEKLDAIAASAARDIDGSGVDSAMQQYNSTHLTNEYAQAQLKLARRDYTKAQKAYAEARQRPKRAAGAGRVPQSDKLDAARTEFQRAKQARTDALRQAETAAAAHKPNKIIAGQAEQRERNVVTVQNDLENPKSGDFGTYRQAENYFNTTDGQSLKMPVHGESYSPFAKTSAGVRLEKIRRAWYDTMADMPETVMGRTPLYRHVFSNYMKESIDRIGDDGMSLADIDGLRRAADKKARQEVANVLYDSSDTSNASHALRLLTPFFSAWEDTMKKWGKLIYNDPQIGVHLNKVWSAPNNAGMVVDSEGNHVDAQGNTFDSSGNKIDPKGYRGSGQFIVLPKKLGGQLVPGGGKLKISKTSANILFQGNPPWLPGVGPLVQVPTNEISKRMFPDKVENNAILKYVLPYGTTNDNLIDQTLLPSWAKNAKDAFGNSQQHANVYTQLYAQEKFKFDNGDRKTAPTEDEIANRTRNWFLLRAAMSNLAPVTITPQPSTQLYIDKAHAYQANDDQTRATYAQWVKNGSQGTAPPATWMDKFYADFPQYFDLAVSLSTNPSGLNATDDAYGAWKKYKGDIKQNPDLAWFYAGPDNITGEYDPNIYAWEQNTTAGGTALRGRKTYKQAVDDIETQKGWIEYNKANTFLNLQLEQRGLHSFQQTGAEDLAAAKQEYVRQLGLANHAWLSAYGQRDSSKVQSLKFAAESTWKKSPDFRNRSDQQALQSYFQNREYIRQALAARPVHGMDNPDNADIADAWGQYTQQLVGASPGFEQIYNRVLESDDVSKELL